MCFLFECLFGFVASKVVKRAEGTCASFMAAAGSVALGVEAPTHQQHQIKPLKPHLSPAPHHGPPRI